MKVLTLNTHSWLEEEPEKKIKEIGDAIFQKGYDIIALQEVNQLIDTEEVELNRLYCASENDYKIHEDNFALRIVDYLQKLNKEYYWTWIFSHIGYDKYEEGLAILSLEPLYVQDTVVSKDKDIQKFTTRRLLTAVTKLNGEIVKICNCHYSWFSQDGFVTEWKNTEKFLKDSGYPLIMMGDFNNPAYTKGYEMVINSALNLRDSFTAKHEEEPFTISREIDGWKGNKENLRIDFIFSSANLIPLTYQLMFDGRTPIVSDHFGVEASFELSNYDGILP